MTHRTCRTCRRTLLLDAFVVDRRNPTGHTAECKSCHRDRGRRSARRVLAPDTVLDVDEVAVERAVAGDPPGRMTADERRVAVRVLTERGMAHREIARTLRVTPRTVTRARHYMRTVPPFCPNCVGDACRWHPERTAA
ncbi:hypothetical protein [Embleya sp. NPDC005971]|uniref:DUF7368 family protein n=1 Tax=Embleya sp. NPDC005971 TaxID=3156724 RepID=UPI0033EA420D